MKNNLKLASGAKLLLALILVFTTYSCSDDKKEILPETIDVVSVELNKEQVSMKVGETFELLATINPENATNTDLKWESTDKTIVEVENGHLKALAAGEAKITVTTKDGNKTASCTVVVEQEIKEVAIETISIDPSELVLNVGDEKTLIATITPSDATNQELTWSSEDASVATVVEGVVTAVGKGKTTIAAKNSAGDISGSCTVTVNEVVVSFIEDENFNAALLEIEGVDSNKDSVISELEAQSFAGSIDVSSKNISNLKGLEKFVNITGLNCSKNKLTTLDVSKNTALTMLDCSSNELSELDIQLNKELVEFKCFDNKLLSLDISNVTNTMQVLEYGAQKDEGKMYLLVNENKIKSIQQDLAANSNNANSAYFFFQSSKDGKGFSSLNNDIRFNTSEVRYIKLARQGGLQGFGNFNPAEKNWSVADNEGLTVDYFNTSNHELFTNVTIKLSSSVEQNVDPFVVKYKFFDKDGEVLFEFSKRFVLSVLN